MSDSSNASQNTSSSASSLCSPSSCVNVPVVVGASVGAVAGGGVGAAELSILSYYFGSSSVAGAVGAALGGTALAAATILVGAGIGAYLVYSCTVVTDCRGNTDGGESGRNSQQTDVKYKDSGCTRQIFCGRRSSCARGYEVQQDQVKDDNTATLY